MNDEFDPKQNKRPLEDAHYAGQPKAAGPFMETGRTDPPSPELDGDLTSATMPSDALLEDNLHPSEQRGFYNAEDREEAVREGRPAEDGHIGEAQPDERLAGTGGDRDGYDTFRAPDNGDSSVVGIDDGSVNSSGIGRAPDEGSVSIGPDAREFKEEQLDRSSSNAASGGRIPDELVNENGFDGGVPAPGADPNLGPAPFGEEVEPVIDNYESNVTRDRIDERHRERFL
ncbi:hypothetical protein [Bhargavaea beijingensis]|uniref:Uncharacterized protein n=1 Tax=Bhargavaea beijingensis TaxID=426756 RepID=A0A1G7BV54_9BACL|nr:hypothetical protein [Bhargavaea beijingensis]MCW1926676.1 hypothetical protein [Bhargavaea beijingensis]RSK37069.1 hypothetical protein EJA12_01695 [Bhargavaea beijingensis]SDE30949.1 hypothetical protein SAMN04488126_106135 [Bhargavaea beijingensis]